MPSQRLKATRNELRNIYATKNRVSFNMPFSSTSCRSNKIFNPSFYILAALRSLGKTIRRTLSFQGNAANILCDELKQEEKILLCEKMRLHLVDQKIGVRLYDFQYAESNVPPPDIVDPANPYNCEDTAIQHFDMAKRMFWCEAKRYRNGTMLPYQHMDGFLLASGQKTGRVYAFRPPKPDSREVNPVAEMNDVELILQYVPRLGSFKRSSSMNSSSSARSS